jgi:hypothetical protein
MAVSYNLDVKNFGQLEEFSRTLVNIGKFGAPNLFDSGRWLTPSATTPIWQIYPTGEYIIRKGMYVNGFYIYVGSYKAYCIDLFGTNNHGYAWDGFIMAIRGYSLEEFPIIPKDDPNGLPSLTAFGFLPMRMMYEVNCGPIGDASDIAGDSSVGLYGLDVFKSNDDFSVNDADKDIKIITCGKQRINASAETAPTGMDYVGNLYMGRLLRYSAVVGNEVQYIYNGSQAFPSSYDMMQITWRANEANHTDKTNESGRFNRIFDLEESIGVIEEVGQAGGAIWDYESWILGNSPPTQKLAYNSNVFPRSFLDITCLSQQPISMTTLANSVFLITGEASLDTNNDGTANKNVPMAMGCAYPFFDFISGVFSQPPFMNINPALATSLSSVTSYHWGYDGDSPAYTWDDAQAVFCSQPYEALDLTLPYTVDEYPYTLLAINNINFGGTNYGAIYSIEGSIVQPSFAVFPLAVQGGSFTTATGINLPNKFYGKAVQQRTFSIPEEDIAKQGVLNLDTGEFNPTNASVYDSDAKEYIGYISNYQRYGAFNLGDPSEEPTATAGQLTGSGYGFLGIKDGTGPIAIMFDSGSPLFDASGNWNIVVRDEGSNLNSNTISNPTSTTRKIINCGWDNDRDQWLFIGSDTNDVSLISASSDFSTATNNVGFLDQTNNFVGLLSGTDSAFYFPISMSNSLDGWVWFGQLVDGDIAGITSASIGSSETVNITTEGRVITFSYTAYPNATTQIMRITGTTGRTARVWVDYILFDGPDAIIANKLKERGMKVSIEAVEWFKRTIIQTGDLNITAEEIEMWMRDQQDEYKQTLKEIERQGRLRRRKKQVSAYTEGMEEQIDPDFMDTEVKDFMGTFTPDTRPPTPEEARIEKKKKGGYTPQQGSYYDEVFED